MEIVEATTLEQRKFYAFIISTHQKKKKKHLGEEEQAFPLPLSGCL